MLVGVPKEIKPQENRVGLIPAGVRQLVSNGHSVIVEQSAGAGSGILMQSTSRREPRLSRLQKKSGPGRG